jgi:mono/diheme cytochrome c family protein
MIASQPSRTSPMTKTWFLTLALAACGGSKPLPPSAEPVARTEPSAETTPAPPGNDVLEQAALAEQYDVGKRLYTGKKCASCHEANGAGNPTNPPVIGAGALPAAAPKAAKLRKGIEFATAKDVLAFVKAKMPLKAPGTLSDEEAAAITSWMLSESKVNITRKLDAANASSVALR